MTTYEDGGRSETKAPRYTVFDGDEIHRDGIPWLLVRGTGVSPADGSAAVPQRIADLLNQHGE